MPSAEEILLLTSDQRAAELIKSAPVVLSSRNDPFAALKELNSRNYAAILVDAETPNLPDLLEAMKKLRPATRVYALCSPRGEYELRRTHRLDSLLLEDYFICPPTRDEWRRISGLPPRKKGQKAAETGSVEKTEDQRYKSVARIQPVSLDGRQISRLIEAATDVNRLASCVAELASDVCGCDVAWRRGPDQDPPGKQQLLRMDTEPPMTLWAAEIISPEVDCSRWISALRMQLPSLLDNVRKISTLKRLATVDDLTGAYNRRYFMHFAQKMLDTCRKHRKRATVLLYDIDDFKVYNDNYSHATGDEILRETASMMRQITRKHDLVARIGGDEFAVLFCELEPRQPGSKPLQTAYDLADRFRQAVNSHVFPSLGEKAQGELSISGGLANFPWDGATISELLASADEALLEAKKQGKNNIRIIGSHD